jgi:hypothetical protein
MYNPDTNMTIAKARQDDLIREARRRELARQVPRPERRGLSHLFAGLMRRRAAGKPAATSA